jgi:formate dehydrogenase major subunit
MLKLVIDSATYDAEAAEYLIDVINRTGKELPQVCYHPQLGVIQTCDTCLVEVDGQLVRPCGSTVSEGMQIVISRDVDKDELVRGSDAGN